MRRRALLVPVLAVLAFAPVAPAAAAPDPVGCTSDLAGDVARYDPESVESYPGFLVASAVAYAGCVA